MELLIQANLVAVVDQPPMTLCGRGGVPAGVGGRLQHIGIGRMHTGTHVLLLVQDLHLRVIDAAAGEIFRVLDSGPTRDYRVRAFGMSCDSTRCPCPGLCRRTIGERLARKANAIPY